LSIHVNALAEGEATGASIHTLSEIASTEEAAALASYENRSDVLAGVELAGEGDDVALALIDLSRRRTNAASRALARALIARLDGEVALLDGRAHSVAGFRVLKSPDIPSALVELGFMSTPQDLARIEDPAWRARFALAMLDALDAWKAGAAAR
jgi:N-acetylmuramoyl-L-alanine amidase